MESLTHLVYMDSLEYQTMNKAACITIVVTKGLPYCVGINQARHRVPSSDRKECKWCKCRPINFYHIFRSISSVEN